MKFKKLSNGLQVSLSGNRASAGFRAQIPTQEMSDEAKRVLAGASLWCQQRASVEDTVNVPQTKLTLTDDRYVYANFRALSQVFLENRGLDFSRPGVLEAAVPMLLGKTVYPNHDFTDINNWVGVVSQTSWDAAGANSGGTPGIRCQVKLDAYLNYRIACGVMMSPPAINAMSLTVMFEFEFSHPEIANENRWRFFDLLGEEVDGQIVRLIVTKIVEIWEASLVPVGEDRLAVGEGDDGSDDDESDDNEDFAEMSAKAAAGTTLPPNSNEEKTMNIPKQKRTELGIEFDGDDVPETELLKAAESLATRVTELTTSTEAANVAELQRRAEAGDALVEEKRKDVTRLARIAELGADEGELDEVVTDQIAAADVDKLQKLHAYFTKKAADRLPAGGRSSLENSDEVDKAGGTGEVKAQPKKVSVH